MSNWLSMGTCFTLMSILAGCISLLLHSLPMLTSLSEQHGLGNLDNMDNNIEIQPCRLVISS